MKNNSPVNKGLILVFIAIESKSKTPAKVEKTTDKKTRKKKDVDAPKKPMSAFFWY